MHLDLHPTCTLYFASRLLGIAHRVITLLQFLFYAKIHYVPAMLNLSVLMRQPFRPFFTSRTPLWGESAIVLARTRVLLLSLGTHVLSCADKAVHHSAVIQRLPVDKKTGIVVKPPHSNPFATLQPRAYDVAIVCEDANIEE